MYGCIYAMHMCVFLNMQYTISIPCKPLNVDFSPQPRLHVVLFIQSQSVMLTDAKIKTSPFRKV